MKDIIKKIKNNHADFNAEELESDSNNPMDTFRLWLKNAVEKEISEANAFSINTVDESSQPSSRMVYLKEIIDESFVFYTNFNSQKAKAIANNPKVAMLFYWPSLAQQIRIEGECTEVDDSLSDAYFTSRPRGSKIGAWASAQSEPLESLEDLKERVRHFEEKYPNKVPRPKHWGGFAIQPTRMEFWQGKPSRLHHRKVFMKDGNDWKNYFLNP